MHRAGVWEDCGKPRPMDSDLPPLKCFSYSFPSALKPSRRPLIGAMAAERRVARALGCYRAMRAARAMMAFGLKVAESRDGVPGQSAPVTTPLQTGQTGRIIVAPSPRHSVTPSQHPDRTHRARPAPSPVHPPDPFERGPRGSQPHSIPASLEPPATRARTSAQPVTAGWPTERPVARRQWSTTSS